MAFRFWPPAKRMPPRPARQKPIIQLRRATVVERTPFSRASSPSSTTARMRAPSVLRNSRARSPKATAAATTTWKMRS